MHLYLYGQPLRGQQGRQVRQLTRGDWIIDSSAWNLLTPGHPVHVDPSGGWAYFITTKNSPLEREILRVNLVTGRLEQVSESSGFHAFTLSRDGRYLVDQSSDVTTPPVTRIAKTGRIGTDGKSFGGYMTLYALIFAPEVFHCGVAGAAPTDWRYYDTIYTERYMGTPADNPDGYAATNLIDRAGQIQAAPLLIHGLADTNVHFQNTVNFVEALEANDKQFSFIPLPNLGHSFRDNGLVAALMASETYLAQCLAEPTR